MQQTNKIPNFNCCFSKESDDNACSLSKSCETLIFGRFNGDKNSVCACVDFVYYFYESYVFISNSWNIRIDISCQIDRLLTCLASSTTTVKNWQLTFFANGEQPFFKSRELEGIEKGGFVCDGFLKFLIWIYTMHNFWGGEKAGGWKKTVCRLWYTKHV